MPEPAQVRLERLLYLLPAAARDGGARLDELARALDASPADLLRDIQEATARAFYLPPGQADSIQITIEKDRVQVFAGRQFQRPVRLSQREALALGLGLRIMAAEREDAAGRNTLLALASRMEQSLAVPMVREAPRAMPGAPVPAEEAAPYGAAEDLAPPPSLQAPRFPFFARPSPPARERQSAAAGGIGTPPPIVLHIEQERGPVKVELGEDAFRGIMADGVREHRRVTLSYLRPGARAPEPRTVEPLRLVYANGRWYLAAQPVPGDEPRIYRLDRVLGARLEAEHFEPGPIDISSFIDEAGRAYSARDAVVAQVRYSPRVARWVSERTRQAASPDGSITVEHSVADPDWLARHVLQYGADAEVVGPPSLREHVASIARSLASHRGD